VFPKSEKLKFRKTLPALSGESDYLTKEHWFFYFRWSSTELWGAPQFYFFPRRFRDNAAFSCGALRIHGVPPRRILPMRKNFADKWADSRADIKRARDCTFKAKVSVCFVTAFFVSERICRFLFRHRHSASLARSVSALTTDVSLLDRGVNNPDDEEEFSTYVRRTRPQKRLQKESRALTFPFTPVFASTPSRVYRTFNAF